MSVLDSDVVRPRIAPGGVVLAAVVAAVIGGALVGIAADIGVHVDAVRTQAADGQGTQYQGLQLAGLFAFFIGLAVTPFVAWTLMRLGRLKHPGLTAVLGTILSVAIMLFWKSRGGADVPATAALLVCTSFGFGVPAAVIARSAGA
jgi:hypothetical protein